MSEYKASRQLVELTCNYCHKKIQIDGEDQTSVAVASDWIMLFPATSLDKIAACSKEHAARILKGLSEPKIEIISN